MVRSPVEISGPPALPAEPVPERTSTDVEGRTPSLDPQAEPPHLGAVPAAIPSAAAPRAANSPSDAAEPPHAKPTRKRSSGHPANTRTPQTHAPVRAIQDL